MIRPPRTKPGGWYQNLSPSRGHGSLVNCTGFGRALQRACRSERVLRAMPDHGFFDGGCLTLAIALAGLIGDRADIRCIRREDPIDHAVCAVRIRSITIYLDADGLGDARDLKAKMAWLEDPAVPANRWHITRPSMRGFRKAGLDDWENKSQTIATLLKPVVGRWGDPETWLSPAASAGKQPVARPLTAADLNK